MSRAAAIIAFSILGLLGSGCGEDSTTLPIEATSTLAGSTSTLGPTTSGGPVTTAATPEADVATSTVGEEEDDGRLSGPVLFTSEQDMLLAFDVLNTRLFERSGLERIDLVGTPYVLPNSADGSGAFGMTMLDDGALGGWLEVDGTISRAMVDVATEDPRSNSAVFTLLSITLEDDDVIVADVSAALTEVGTGPTGGSAYVVFDGRGVLVEKRPAPDPGEAVDRITVTVAGETDEPSALAAATELREELFPRLPGR